MALVSAAASVVVGRTFGLIELYVIGAALVAAVLVAAVAVSMSTTSLSISRRPLPPVARVGDPARVHIEVSNTGRHRTPSLRLWEPVGDDGGAFMHLASLRPGGSATAAYRVPTARRGVMLLGPAEATRSDILGLWSRSAMIAGQQSLVVVPQVVTLAAPRVGSAGRLGQQLAARSLANVGTEFHSMRDYVPGDDLRRVSWRASARSDDLVVRQAAPDALTFALVVLDTRRPARFDASTGSADTDSAAFERAVSIAASVVTTLAETLSVRFVAPGIDLQGPGVAATALRWLAGVRSVADDAPVTPTRTGSPDQLGIAVVVSQRADGPILSSVRSCAGPSCTMLLVSVDDGERLGARAAAAADATTLRVSGGGDLQRFQHSWNEMVAGPGGRGPFDRDATGSQPVGIHERAAAGR
jgi:hypothetical protein